MDDAVREQAVARLCYLGCEVSAFGAVCAEFAAQLYGGLHHFPLYDRGIKRVDWNADHYLSWTHYGEWGSWDGSELTVAVLLAHDLGLRVTIRALAPRYTRLALGKRDVDGCFSGWTRHPTMEETLAEWRERHPPRIIAEKPTTGGETKP
jgi:hypothetical protein